MQAFSWYINSVIQAKIDKNFMILNTVIGMDDLFRDERVSICSRLFYIDS